MLHLDGIQSSLLLKGSTSSSLGKIKQIEHTNNGNAQTKDCFKPKNWYGKGENGKKKGGENDEKSVDGGEAKVLLPDAKEENGLNDNAKTAEGEKE